MKKINLLLIMLLTTATSLFGKCDWSKVYLTYGNSCNVYKFEIAGTVDTCYKTTTIVTNKKTLKKDTFYTRSFGISFADTGKYNMFVKVYNKCLNCDTAFEKLLYVTCKPTTKPKCDWSKLGFGYSNSCNIYKFELGSIDTCLSYKTYIYSYKTARVTDTLYGRTFTKVFADTGKYKVYVMAYNKCGGCDTAFYKLLTVTCKPTTKPKCDWSKVKPGYSYSGRSYKFEISSYDTCLTYTNLRYGKGKVDTLNHDRIFGVTFSDTGIWYIISRIHNKCTGCDTSFYIRLHVTDPTSTTKGCDWSKIGLYTSNKCRTVVFELGSKDTCITKYSLWAYSHNTHKFDTLAHDRVFTRTLDTGWYTFKASFYNKCCNKDTFIYKEIHIGCDSMTTGISFLTRNFIRISPNPSNDFVMVCLTNNSKQPRQIYTIYDGNGRIINDGIIVSCITLNTLTWRDGIYTIKIGNLVSRIVVRH
jgi:hypothetical protein